MKIGDLVTNSMAVHTNTAVHSKRYEAGKIGVVTKVEQTDLNKRNNANGQGDIYVDVVLATEDGPISCGRYLASVFEVINETR